MILHNGLPEFMEKLKTAIGVDDLKPLKEITGAEIEEIDPEPDHDDTVYFCPDCERPNQFGEICPSCQRERRDQIA